MSKRKMSVGVKLIISFIVVSLISLVIGVIAIYNMNTINGFNDRLYKNALLGLSYTKEANIDMLYMARAEKNIILASTMDDRNGYIKQSEDYQKLYLDNIKNAKPLFYTDDGKQKIKDIEDAYNNWIVLHNQVIDLVKKENLNEKKASSDLSMGLARDKVNILDKDLTDLTRIKEANAKDMADQGTNTFITSLIIMIVIVIIGFSLGLTLGIVISRGISRPITEISDSLKSSASQIGVASNQLSSSSQEIANGATEQASSIEETTSSMEELASMVKQNAGNAQEASTLAEKAAESSQTGHAQMESMLVSMTDINKSSEQIKKVIKVIDDIAFQTNILALNAAVEAARAGEAGMGFAVVADEVKNLANKSAEAAKETADMIEDSIKKTELGLQTATRLGEIFKEILASVKKVADMSKEVETASKQQDTGINQVNKAIVQFDEVVQENASSAEETASSAEELLAQVETLNDIVGKLIYLVTGKQAVLDDYAAVKHSVEHREIADRRVDIKKKREPVVNGTKQKQLTHSSNLARVKDKKEVSPEQVIPFEEDEEFREID